MRIFDDSVWESAHLWARLGFSFSSREVLMSYCLDSVTARALVERHELSDILLMPDSTREALERVCITGRNFDVRHLAAVWSRARALANGDETECTIVPSADDILDADWLIRWNLSDGVARILGFSV
jgi:hypothetical protein